MIFLMILSKIFLLSLSLPLPDPFSHPSGKIISQMMGFFHAVVHVIWVSVILATADAQCVNSFSSNPLQSGLCTSTEIACQDPWLLYSYMQWPYLSLHLNLSAAFDQVDSLLLKHVLHLMSSTPLLVFLLCLCWFFLFSQSLKMIPGLSPLLYLNSLLWWSPSWFEVPCICHNSQIKKIPVWTSFLDSRHVYAIANLISPLG